MLAARARTLFADVAARGRSSLVDLDEIIILEQRSSTTRAHRFDLPLLLLDAGFRFP